MPICSAIARTGLAWLILLGLLNGPAWAQELPPPPPDRLLDDTRALSDAEHTALANDLAKFRADFGYDIRIAASTFLASGRTVRQHARELRQAWSGTGPAVILAYDRASDSHSISVAPVLWDRYPASRLILLMQQSSALMADAQRPLNERLIQASNTLIRTFRLLEKHQKQLANPLPAGARRLATRFVPLMLIGAVIAAVAGFRMRRRDVLTNWQMLFPSVQVGIRLGAPFGGGATAEWPPRPGVEPAAATGSPPAAYDTGHPARARAEP